MMTPTFAVLIAGLVTICAISLHWAGIARKGSLEFIVATWVAWASLALALFFLVFLIVQPFGWHVTIIEAAFISAVVALWVMCEG